MAEIKSCENNIVIKAKNIESKDESVLNNDINGHSNTNLNENSNDNDRLQYYDTSNGPPINMDKWVNKPMCLTLHAQHVSYQSTNYDKQVCIPLNKVFDFESRLFKGQIICRAIDFPDSETWYFKDKHRKMDFTYQGVFKKKIRFDRLLTGQIFDKPFTKLPGQYLINAGLKLLKSLAPSLIADVECNTPHLLTPLCSAAQIFNIATDKSKVKPLPLPPDEDISLLDAKYKGLDWQARKKLFHDKEILKKYYFEPGYYYTLSHYTHMVSPQSYNLLIAGMKFGLHYYIPSPFQVSCVVLPSEEEKKKYKLVKKANNNTTITPIKNGNHDSKTSENDTNKSIDLWFKDRTDDNADTKIEWNTDGLDMLAQEYVFNFQMWHTELVKELYKKDKKQANGKLKKIWGKKK